MDISGESLKSASYLEAAVMMGLLESQSKDTLNLVNAPALAKELGIKVSMSLQILPVV